MNLFLRPILLSLIFTLVGCSSFSGKGVNRNIASNLDSFDHYSLDRMQVKEIDLKLENMKDYDQIAFLCLQAKFSKAVEGLRALPQEERKNPSYWNTAGLCQYRKKDYAQALGSFQVGLTLSQNKKYSKSIKAGLLNNLGLLAFHFNRIDESKSFFSEAIKLDEDNALLHFNFASVAFSLGHISIAKDSILKLSKLNPKTNKDPDVLLLAAQIALSEGQAKRSYQYLSQVIPELQNREDIGSLLSLNYLIIGKKAQAKETLSKITQVSDKRNHVLINKLKQTLELLDEIESASEKERS